MEKILIIDDSLVQADVLKSILKDNYDVTAVHTAEAGLQHAASGMYSLILLDVIMPEMDGFTLLKELQEAARRYSDYQPFRCGTRGAGAYHGRGGLHYKAV